MEFLVQFDLAVPEGTPGSEVEQRVTAEAAAFAKLGREGHLVRLWRPPLAPGERKAVGLYRADSQAHLDGLLGALPLSGWMQTSVTPLEPNPNDPVEACLPGLLADSLGSQLVDVCRSRRRTA
jgi:muconolactone D-isomerase